MSTDIEIVFTNPSGDTVRPTLIGAPALDDYLDRPRRCTLKIAKGSAIDPHGTVRVTRKGTIKLIGHITKLDESNAEQDTIICDSAEALISERVGQFYRFPAGTQLQTMLDFLIKLANGLIPRGDFELYSGHIYRIKSDPNGIRGGTNARRFGTLAELYQNTTALTKKTSLGAMTAGSWYQSADDLFVWTTTGATPANFCIIAPNFKDTLIRLGNIENGSTTFAVVFEIGDTLIWPTIQALVTAAGLEYEPRCEKDNRVYLDAKITVGRGSSASPVATFINGKNAEINTQPMDGQASVQALLGQGAGQGLTKNCSAAVDHNSIGTFREAIYSMPNLFGSMLQTAVVKVFTDRQDSIIYSIRSPTQDWSLGRGDYIQIIREGYQPVIKRVKRIGYKSAGDMIIEAGQRLKTVQELIKGDQDVQRILQSFYGSHNKNAWSWSMQQQNIDSYTPISQTFLLASTDDSQKSSDDKTLGSGEIDPNFPFTVLLSLKIGWYTSSLLSATSPGDSHSNVGGHGGYGGGSTSAKTQDAHSVQQMTGDASTSFVAVPYQQTVYGSTYTGAASITADLTPLRDSGNDTYYFWQNFRDYGHAHGVNIGLGSITIPSNNHTHVMPGHYTNAAGAQSHETQHESAQTRAGSSAHPDKNLTDDNQRLDYYLNNLPTGHSVHYLTLAIKVNNVDVPGSPFSGGLGTGLYVGDSLDNIDISELVLVGQKNTITIQVSEFGGSGPVRCSISGNVNVNGIISAF